MSRRRAAVPSEVVRTRWNRLAGVVAPVATFAAASGEVTARVEVADTGAERLLSEREKGVIVVDRTAGRVVLIDSSAR
jgi:hypothetical protein